MGGLEGGVGGEVETFKGGEEGKIESTSRPKGFKMFKESKDQDGVVG